MKEIAKTVSRLQRVHGLSKTATAEQLNISRRTVGRLLDLAQNPQETYRPSLETASHIAKFFKIGLGDANKRLPAFMIETAI